MKICKGTNKYRYNNYKFEKCILPSNDEKKRRKGYSVYIYIYENGKDIGMYPFSSYSLVSKTLNINSNIISKYIDTGKSYKNKYVFSSIKFD